MCVQLGTLTNICNQREPIRVFEDKEDIWRSNIGILDVKSARN